MILSFTLSMPNNNAWDGKWSGEGKLYAVTRSFSSGNKRAQQILDKGYFTYNFGDGWTAGIHVRKVDAKEAARIRKKSRGFYGYDWMVKSIILELKIEP